jgi:putative effector of murein hydrolase
VFITLLAAVLGKIIEDRLKSTVFNRFIIALVLILLFIFLTGTEYEQYKTGGDILSAFLGPATVALAIPLYEQLSVLIKNKFVVIISITTGCVISFASIFICSKVFLFGQDIYLSTLPKSVTTPVALMLSQEIGGISALTMFCVVIAGIVGATILPVWQNF